MNSHYITCLMNLCEWSNGRCSSTGFIFWVSRVKTLSALCCMHTEVRFRWAEAGEPRRDRILRPSGSQAELWPRLARRRHANGRVQTGSSVFRQKQRCKTGGKNTVFPVYINNFLRLLTPAVFIASRLVFILSKPYGGAPWDPMLWDAVGGRLLAPDPPWCH